MKYFLIGLTFVVSLLLGQGCSAVQVHYSLWYHVCCSLPGAWKIYEYFLIDWENVVCPPISSGAGMSISLEVCRRQASFLFGPCAEGLFHVVLV